MTNKAILVIIVVVVCSCNGYRAESTISPEIPSALQDDKKDMSIVSKRSYEDLVEQLYNEQVEKSKELQDIEKEIKVIQTNKADTISALLSFDTKNKTYYLAADTKIKSISDSVLRSKIAAMLSASSLAYDEKIAEMKSLLKLLEKKTISLEDYHLLLKIKQTLPLMEKYQETNKPSNNPIKELIKTYDQLIEKMDRKTSN